ncbi:MAG: peptidoglycan editing factor PgeF [Eubacteriales bacterium]|nr:peptidoglycan editing factor PgeF [Eubacteriales bacterium]
MNANMERKTAGELVYYTSRTIEIPHLFTTKFGGVSTGHVASLNLGFNRGDEPENVRKNYDILAGFFGVPKERLTCTRQVHNDEVGIVTEKEIGMGLGQPNRWSVDAVVTNLPGVPLCGFYADCVVTLLYDPVSRCIAACHSGWRGTAKGILKKTVRTMGEQYGAKPEDIRAVIGPSIRECCFETDRDVPDAMLEEMGDKVRPYIAARGAKYFPDLQGINTMLLQEAGVVNIVDSGICTKCHCDVFWSHRATQGRRGVHAGVIMLPME